MNETQHLLTILAEECAEAAQRASKAIRFGMADIEKGQDEHNRRRLEREVADVVAMSEMLGLNIRAEDKAAKVERVKKYMDYSREVGMLEERK